MNHRGNMKGAPRWRQVAFVALMASLLSPTADAMQCSAGTIKFHQDGGIQRCVIDAHHRLFKAKEQPIDCIAGHTVTLFANGKLESCRIRDTHVVLGMPCSGPARIELDEIGALRGCLSE
tara:strand:+ start:7150 stop:7509 length:360 start_codon:yes stop_codon:yes gene_type:complete